MTADSLLIVILLIVFYAGMFYSLVPVGPSEAIAVAAVA